MTAQTWFGITVAVELAWGADITADPSTWAWTDITQHVRQSPGISWSLGRNDEGSASQPAKCAMTLTNTSGAYSLGGQASNWPNVRRGTPVRVRLNPDGAGYITAFQGETVGFTPNWDLSGNDATVALEAAGALRRLAQNSQAIRSALTRALPTADGVLAYWPCEEPDEAARFESGLDGGQAMTWAGAPDLATTTSFPGSASLPKLKGSWWSAGVTSVAATGELQIRALVEFPDDDTAEAEGTILSLYTTGTAARFNVDYVPTTGGLLAVRVYDSAGTQIHDTTSLTFNVNRPTRARRYSLSLTQNGSNIDAVLSTTEPVRFGVYTALITAASFTVSSRTLGAATRVQVNVGAITVPPGALDDVTVGHVTVQTAVTSTVDAQNEVMGYANERADDRLQRLCDENGEALTVTGAAGLMLGPQPLATFVDLLRECETVDQGVLYDGATAGLSYVGRDEIENEPAVLTLDATASQLAEPFDAVDDDQRTVNRAIVTRSQSVTRTVEDADGMLGVDTIGPYEASLTVNTNDDDKVEDYAGWLVHLGTVEGYRHPSVTLDLRDNITLARDWLSLRPGHRVDIDNIDDVLPGYPAGTVSLYVEGKSQHLGDNTWRGTLNCSPYQPWQVAQLGSGNTSPISFVGAGTATAASSGSITPGLPSGWQTNDLLLIFASTRNSGTGTVDTPTGWTALATSGNTTVLGKIASGGDTDPTITFTGGAANETTIAQTAAFRGTHQDIDSVLLASAVQLNASAANIAYPSLTVSEDNCAVVVAGWKQDDWTSVATLSGMTEIEEKFSTLGSDAGQVWDYVIQSTHANISASSFTVTGGTSQISRGLTFALRPNPDPEPTLFRLDTPGSTLTSNIAQGATSMSVTTTGAVRSIGFIGAGAFVVADNASLNPAFPVGWNPGDMLFTVASIRNSGTGTVNTPSGWSVLLTSGNLTLLGRVAVAGDTAPTITFAGGAAGATTMAQCFAFNGLHPDTTAVVANSAAQLNGSAQNIARPALTVPADNSLILLVWWKQDDSTTVANDVSFYGGPDDGSTTTGSDASTGVDYLIQTTASNFSSGTLTVTGGAAAISRCMMLALSSAVGPIWSTDSSDYPMHLEVGGIEVVATACTDTTSPQTMTIQSAALARSAGVPVKLWQPPALSL
jgi:hypothetical protein